MWRLGSGTETLRAHNAFRCLTDILHVTERNDRPTRSAEYMFLFLRLPAVKRIFGGRVGGYWRHIPDPKIEAVSTVSRIELRDCLMKEEHLAYLMRAPVALKTFIYDIASGVSRESQVYLVNIRCALKPQERHLENLWLDHDHRSGKR